jgi:hypothetical protein
MPVTGVGKRERNIPMEIQQQAAGGGSRRGYITYYGVAAPVVGPWGRGSGSGSGSSALNQRAGRGEAAGLRPVQGTRARI